MSSHSKGYHDIRGIKNNETDQQKQTTPKQNAKHHKRPKNIKRNTQCKHRVPDQRRAENRQEGKNTNAKRLNAEKQNSGKRETMRHPAAPTIVAVLLGLLGLLMLWGRWRDDGYHEGNPHPDDVPRREDVAAAGGGEESGEEEEDENEEDEEESRQPRTSYSS